MQNVNIARLEKAEVLAALYNNAKLPRGTAAARVLRGPYVMEKEWAQTYIEARGPLRYHKGQFVPKPSSLWFEALYERQLWVGINYIGFHPAAYDHYNGRGSAAEAIRRLRETGDYLSMTTEQVDVWRKQVIRESLECYGNYSVGGDASGATLRFLTGMARHRETAWIAKNEHAMPTLAVAFAESKKAGEQAMKTLAQQDSVDPVA